ncbi:hypothetical protein QCE63_33825 [Caballeronia sp. LZ065]|uniref:hypothetical protein n=1 Tax=Caballeronia sp. LZ065 TaxID=3038571 RepID=UPI00285DD2B6|nr:hypothetical protein [Caballeronia sp. LZ065]MDR5784404.1 hypothetical protein [Caballeronia sp. LZ065]
MLTLLAQQLLISEELCVAGYERARLESVREGLAALVRVDVRVTSNSHCILAGADYEVLREALVIYDVQLRTARPARVRDAQLATVSRLQDRLHKHEQVVLS